MSYTTNAKVIARFENELEVAFLTNTSDTGVPDQAVITECRGRAEGEIDSYLRRRYQVPVDCTGDTTLAAILDSAALDLAQYNLLVRGNVMPEAKKNARENVLVWLNDIVEGNAELPATAVLASTQSESGKVAWGTAGTGDTSQRRFTRATQENL